MVTLSLLSLPPSTSGEEGNDSKRKALGLSNRAGQSGRGQNKKLEKAEISKWFSDEATVTFILGGTKYHGWMPSYAVDFQDKWLKAFIVGDFANGDWEIFIPDETLQSTKFLRVS